jgi:hypothetical protein
MKYFISYIILLGIMLCCCLLLIHKHFKVTSVAYDLSDLKNHVKRKKEHLQELKVDKSKLLVPSFLDNAAGRGGYVIPRTEQIIILPQEE